ncbi:MAG: CPBP family intramembrane metalloprotease [Leptospiraceae bacterium]|nr:CPBP family intramembrane metalloprotease [Leptospiraceae bacterium]
MIHRLRKTIRRHGRLMIAGSVSALLLIPVYLDYPGNPAGTRYDFKPQVNVSHLEQKARQLAAQYLQRDSIPVDYTYSYFYHQFELSYYIDRANAFMLPENPQAVRDLRYIQDRQIAFYVLRVEVVPRDSLLLNRVNSNLEEPVRSLAYEFNPFNGALEWSEQVNIPLPADVSIESYLSTYLKQVYRSSFKLSERYTNGREVTYVFHAEQNGNRLSDRVTLSVADHAIVYVYRQTDVDGLHPAQEIPTPDWMFDLAFVEWPILFLIGVFGSMITYFSWRRTTSLLIPTLITAICALCVYVSYVIQDGYYFDADFLEYYIIEALYLWALFLALVQLANRRTARRWWNAVRVHLAPMALIGLALALILAVLDTIFYEIVQQLGGWWSSMHATTVYLRGSAVPVFLYAFTAIIPAALLEEAVYRHWIGGGIRTAVRSLSRIFGKGDSETEIRGLLVILEYTIGIILSSLLWGIVHLGYDVYPWYLRIVEFVLYGGPFFYIIWRRYGLMVSISTHLWINFLYILLDYYYYGLA